MIKALQAKRKNKKGFTLMEMLIVIAIIAILIAIAIPTFAGALDKAKYSADLANVRAWYAEQIIQEMTEETFALPTTYTGPKLQMKGAKAEPTGTTADTFVVVYQPNGTDTADTKYPNVDFGKDPTP